jgi:putative endonuclease
MTLKQGLFSTKLKSGSGFTKKYNLHKLVYFEQFGNVREAICREKQIKRMAEVEESQAN